MTRINFSWLTRLRWGAIGGQLATILGVHRLMGIPLPLVPLLVVIALEAATNIGAIAWLRTGRRVGEAALAGTMGLDVAFLTALLFFTGGPFNPFSFLYLVHIALAAVVLAPAWTWALVGLSLVCSGGLFYGHRWLSLDWSQPQSHAQHMQMHLQGMWIAFGVAAAFIVYFVTRVRRALAVQRAAAARNERLASLATLAAGAAHELATPLGTIAVAVREIELAAERQRAASLDDARLIRAQVERCRAILRQLAADAGESAGEAPARTAVGAIVAEAVRDLAPAPPVHADLGTCEGAQLLVPARVVAQAVRAIVKNAQEVSPPGATVTVTASASDGALALLVADAGPGMTGDVLARAGEPFFTTKPPGKGMGLGLFLARTVAEQLGGGLQIRSDPRQGTRVTLMLPVQR